jgi:hypothetical protein
MVCSGIALKVLSIALCPATKKKNIRQTGDENQIRGQLFTLDITRAFTR